jgi:MYXO-CTERM domain-containing protein
MIDMRRIARFTPCAAAATLAWPSLALAAQYEVGAAQTYKSPCALFAAVTLQPGDVVLVDSGTYTDACQITQSGSAQAPLVMKGATGARPVFDATGLDLSGSGSVPRAIFQFTGASHWRVSHLELKNASGDGANGAAFRATAGSDDVVVFDDSIHDNQDGLMSDGAGTFTITGNDIFHNGAGDGESHNMYLSSDTARIVGNYIHDSNGGQNVKLRVHYAEVLYNLIANAGNYEMDLIQGSPLTDEPHSNCVLIGNVIVRNPMAANDGQTIVFGSDNPGQTGRNGNFYAINNTFVMTASSNRLVHAISPAAGAQIIFYDNIIHATVAGTDMSYDATTAALFTGSNNWVTTGVTSPAGLTATVGGADPGFVGTSDFHLSASSPARGKGTSMLSYVDGTGATQAGAPTQEFADLGAGAYGTINRLQEATIDLGAFEYGTPDGRAPDAGVAGGGAADASGGGGEEGGAGDDSGVSTMPAEGGAGDGATGGGSSSGGCGIAAELPSGAGPGAFMAAVAAAGLFARRRRRRAGSAA